MKKILSYVAIFVLVIATVGVTTTFVAKATEESKVHVCHRDEGDNSWHDEEINSSELDNHQEDGDFQSEDNNEEGDQESRDNWCEEHHDEHDQGKLIVTKVIVGNESASADDFSFSVDGGDATTAFDVSGSNELTIDTGEHTIVENPIPLNYTVTYDNCEDVKVRESHEEDEEDESRPTPVCTITNTYVPPVDTSCEEDITTASVVSDTTTMVGANPAESLTFIHSAWNAVISGATWIWGEDPIADPVNNVTETFTKTFVISGTPTGATLDIAADNSYSVSVNGNPVNTDNSEDNFSSTGQDNGLVIPANFLVSGTNTITFTVNNLAQAGGTAETNPAGLMYKLTYSQNSCEPEDDGGDDEETPTTVTISATKIVCDSEADLPNWGAGASDITSTTASTFLASHPETCHLEPWTFEWAPSGASNPGDNTGVAGGSWTPFTSTINTPATVTIPTPTDPAYVWVREQMKDEYVPFTGDNSDQNVSAELYCNTDAFKYDNYDRVDDMVAGQTYYCVAFNALKPLVGGNLAPTANAGVDQTITLPTNSATLDGSDSTDPDGTITSYAWTFVSGPTTVDPSDLVGPSASPLVAGTYVFQLVVTDNDGAVSAPDTVTITVKPAIIIDTDYCPEMEGFQTNPESCGDEEVTDVCPNIEGVQTEVPKGKHINNAGKCVNNGSTGGGYVGGGSSTGGQVLGAESDVCNWDVNTYMRLGHKNNSEQVKILQRDLLNGYMKAGVPEDGIYGKKTEEAVKAFQLSKKDKILTPWKLTTPTGLFYKTTLVEAKNTICPKVILPIPTDLTPWSSTVHN